MTPISDDYNPVAQSVDTINKWHKTSNHIHSNVFAASFTITPIFTIGSILIIVIYFNDYAPNNRMAYIAQTLEKKDKNAKRLKQDLQDQFLVSVLLTVYMIAMSSAAVQFSTETERHLNKEVETITSIENNNTGRQHYISAFPMMTFMVDFCIFCAMVATVISMIICYIKKNAYLYLTLIVVTCILVVASVIPFSLHNKYHKLITRICLYFIATLFLCIAIASIMTVVAFCLINKQCSLSSKL